MACKLLLIKNSSSITRTTKTSLSRCYVLSLEADGHRVVQRQGDADTDIVSETLKLAILFHLLFFLSIPFLPSVCFVIVSNFLRHLSESARLHISIFYFFLCINLIYFFFLSFLYLIFRSPFFSFFLIGYLSFYIVTFSIVLISLFLFFLPNHFSFSCPISFNILYFSLCSCFSLFFSPYFIYSLLSSSPVFFYKHLWGFFSTSFSFTPTTAFLISPLISSSEFS
ncbi:unnamed protein product [Acanthosepion pharaonis]|uniref:Uncharacterized protein n=1 Tax=Acanthosepion pharaonis TaxID=158019 RepID=A0A812CTE3_ACAPH|nr:unnamed protein product [Sepia pharaonis]